MTCAEDAYRKGSSTGGGGDVWKEASQLDRGPDGAGEADHDEVVNPKYVENPLLTETMLKFSEYV